MRPPIETEVIIPRAQRTRRITKSVQSMVYSFCRPLPFRGRIRARRGRTSAACHLKSCGSADEVDDLHSHFVGDLPDPLDRLGAAFAGGGERSHAREGAAARIGTGFFFTI